MARRSVNVTFSSADHARIPDILTEGAAVVVGLVERGTLDMVSEQLTIRRQGGYAGIDVFLLLWLYLSAGVRIRLKSFWPVLRPCAKRIAALAGRSSLPSPAAASRALDSVELKLLRPVADSLLADVPRIDEVLRHPSTLFRSARGHGWRVFDVDPKVVTMHQRALPDIEDLPEPERDAQETGAPGHSGRKRGDIQYQEVPVMDAGSGLWLHVHLSRGNGDGVADLRRALESIVTTCDRLDHPLYRSFVRLDGAFGNVPSFTACRELGVPFITRLNRPKLFEDVDVLSKLRQATWHRVPDSGCGPQRSAADIGLLTVAAGKKTRRPDDTPYEPVSVRVVACIFPKRGEAKRGRTIDGWEVELFAVDLCADDWPAADAIAAYYGRNGFENRLAQQDRELGLDRIVSYHLPGQELATIVGLAIWNERVVRGFQLEPPPDEAPVRQLRQPVVDDRVPELWPRDPVLNEMLAELDWATLLVGLPGWSFDPATSELRCDQGRTLTLTTVRPQPGRSGRTGIIFRRPTGGCEDCASRPECLHTDRARASKHVELSVDAEPAEALRERLAQVRRPPTPNRIAPIPHGPGPLDIVVAPFLPAKARHLFRKVFLGATLHVEVSLPPPEPPRPRLIAVDAAHRQRRRQPWAQRSARYALPAGAEVHLQVAGSDALRTILGENRAVISVGGQE